jgi:5'-hydroxyaverantin dehydrogenase
MSKGGAYVTIADIQDEAGKKAAERLTAEGHHVSFVHCDTTNWESSNAAFKHAANFGPRKTIDVAFLNAGVSGIVGPLTEQALAAPDPSLESDTLPERPARSAVAVNFLGMYDGAWLALHYMRLPTRDGSTDAQKALIFTGSMASYADQPYATDYNSSKCA